MSPLYHASFAGNIQEFAPLSHFGTFESACAAAAAKRYEIRRGETAESIAAWEAMPLYLYEVDIDVAGLRTRVVQDFGFSNVPHLVSFLDDPLHHIDPVAMAALHEIRLRWNAMRVEGELDEFADRRMISEVSAVLAADILEYENDIEDDGRPSYAVFDAVNVHVRDKRLLTDEEVMAGYRNMSFYRRAILRQL